MFEALNAALAGIVGKYVAVIAIVDVPLRVAITILLTLLGFLVILGRIQMPVREFVYRALALGTLYIALTSIYGAQIGMFALGGLPSQFATALGGAEVGGLGGFYDQLVGMGFEAIDKMQKSVDAYVLTQENALGVPSLAAIGYIIAAKILQAIVIILAILCAAIGFTISAFALFALALLSVVGPLFVAALVFDSTRGYFFSWLGAMINYLMLIVFTLLLTLFITQAGTTLLATIAETDEVFTAAGKAIAFYMLGFFFFFQVPGLAASLGGGGPALATQFATAIGRGAASLAGAAGGNAVFNSSRTALSNAARATGRGIARGLSRGGNSGGSVSRVR